MSGLDVHVIPTDAPDDTSGLEHLFTAESLDPDNLLCLLGKTEGNGCVNDFSRGLATMAAERAIAKHSAVTPEQVNEEVMLIMSGGTEGVMTPHMTAFSQIDNHTDSSGTAEPRLAGGASRTDAFEPSDIGRLAQVQQTADAVRTAMERAGITDPDHVEFVQIKCPLLTAGKIEQARRNNRTVVTQDTYKSMGYSRAASALGVGLATGELSPDTITNDVICEDSTIYSSVASTSAGVELDHSEVLVLGNSPDSDSELVIGSAVMEDNLDTTAVRTAVERAGLSGFDPGSEKIRNVLTKAQATSDGTIRGRRHVIHDDSDIPATRHARAVVNSVIGAVTGDPLSYVSGGAEHQGPDGGGPVAVIAEAE